MKVIAAVLAVLILMPLASGFANESPLNKARSLLYQGKIDDAISLVEDYIQNNKDAGAYYFLGYAYYEKQDMVTANKYFDEAFKLKSFYSPAEEETP